MTFLWPHFLWLLALPLVATLPRRVGRRNSVPTPESDRILRGTTEARGVRLTAAGGSRAKASRFPRLWIAVALGIVALARPQWGKVDEPVYSHSREILVALDLSRSMLTPDVLPSRLDRAKLLTRGLLEALNGERLGLLVFSGTAFLQCPLSSDYEILREFLPELNPSFLPEGGSNYDALLESALNAFSTDGGADRFLVILSDGEATDEQWKSRLPELKGKGVRVIGLGIGTNAGAIVPDGKGGFVKDRNGAVVMSKLESATLRELSSTTGGSYADASTWVDLPKLIQSTIESGQKGKFTDTTRTRLIERFPWALAPALALLLWSLASEFPVRPQPRALGLVDPAPETPPKPSAVRASALLLFLLASTLLTPKSAHSQPADDSSAAPLVAMTRELSTATSVAPRDWQRLAQATLDYGRRRREGKGTVSEDAIRDGIAATLAGEAADPKAAPWESLRTQLQEFLKPTPTPTPPPEQSPTPSPHPSKEPPSPSPSPSANPRSQDNPGNGENKPSPNPGSPSAPPKQSESPSPKPNPSDSKGDQGQPSPNPQPPPKPQDKSAFGDMNSPKPTPAPPPRTSPETQKVGGMSAAKKPTVGPSPDPQQTAALQKLDQLRDQDSPAVLFQRMQPSPAQQSSNDKDW